MTTKFTTQNGWTKEKMKAHVKLEFRGKSINGNNCLYRGPDGKKCAVGMFIPDDKYSKRMDGSIENGGSNALSVINDYNLHDLMPLERDGMNAMQMVHDDSIPSETLDKMLEFIDEQVVDA